MGPEEVALRNENQQLCARIAELECELGEIADVKANEWLRQGEQQQRAYLAAIVESSDYGIISKTLDGIIKSWNAGAEMLYGYKAEEIVGRSILQLVPPDLHDEIPQILGRLQRGESVVQYETVRLRKDDRRIEVSLTISPVRDGTGTVIGASVITRDITERKRTEETLRRSEKRFRLAVKATNDAIWDIDLVTGTVHWNETYATLYGRPPETSNSWQWWIDRIHPEDRERTGGGLRAAIDGSESTWTCEYRFQRVDGAWAYIYDRAYIARDALGNAWRVIGAMQDLTERRRAEAALRESEVRLKNAERLAHVGHWHWDIRANRVTGSEEMFRIFGKPPDFIPTQEQFLRDIIPQDTERVQREIRACFEGKSGYSTEYQIALPNGDLRTISAIIELARDEEGSPECMFGACQDVTDSRRAQEKAFADQKLESVGRLANGIAHDFNNLMGGVLAQAELALAELASGSCPEEVLQNICTVAIRGAEIVKELMIYAGQECAVLEPVDLSRMVEEMLELLRVSVSKHVALETNLGKDLQAVRASPGQLRQIVMNLVINASEALGDRDGVIRVTTKCVTVSQDWSGGTSGGLADGDYLQLEVSDNGRGMSLETQARVFDPFFTTKSTGHGLGLGVVQGIVRSLHGEILLKSAPSDGTTFQILLPCTDATAEANGPISLTEGAAGQSQTVTVLFVEDEDSLRQPVSKVMRKAGFSVIEARDGAAALDEIRAHQTPLDVLLLDITLPGTPSREVFEEAKRLRPEMRVIITSAYSEGVAAEIFGGKVESFIRKPFRLSDLMDLIRRTHS